MEDTHSLCPNLLEVHACVGITTEWRETLPPRIAEGIREALGLSACVKPAQLDSSMPADCSSDDSAWRDSACCTSDSLGGPSNVEGDTLHFFAVYDGHGGLEVRLGSKDFNFISTA